MSNNSKTQLAKVVRRTPKTQLAKVVRRTRGSVIQRRTSKGGNLVKRRNTTMAAVRQEYKTISIGGQNFDIDAPTFIRMIKQITQAIGEYKRMDNVYSRYIIPSLRKSRSDMLSDLEQHFHVKWEIVDGQSVFYK